MAFVGAINSSSVERLAGLMTEDHVFVDSDGAEYRGRTEMTSGWGGYLAMVPDYRIVVEEAFASGTSVMLSGTAEGTFAEDGTLRPENHWRVPAAWRAVVQDDKIALWQVFVNPEPMTAILKRIRGA